MPSNPINNSPKYRKGLPELTTPETDRFAGMYGSEPLDTAPVNTITDPSKPSFIPNWNNGLSNTAPQDILNDPNKLEPFNKAYDYEQNHMFNPEEQTIFEKLNKGLSGLGKKMLDNRSGIAQGLLYGADAIISNNNEYRNDKAYENAFRNRMQQDPIWDYNAMYGDNQPLIKAEEGAQIRKPGIKGMPIEIEGNEFLLLPDGTAEIAQGPKHKNGGVPTVLPDKSIVYSNKLKPEGSDKTFSQLAKKNDFTEELKTLQNPFSSEIAKTSAERMYNRKRKTLAEIFQKQQMMNGDSSGEPSEEQMEFGGPYYEPKAIQYDEGGTTKLSKGAEEAFRSWMDSIGHNKTNGYNVDENYNGLDYDYRGYWKETSSKPDAAKLLKMEEGQHFPDTFKLPNHDTHSNESMYKQAPRNSKGYWENDEFVEFEEGGEYDLDEKEIERLKKLGYEIEIK